ncbi:MAG: site-specific integrase [Gammaproteobacteria bacterium]
MTHENESASSEEQRARRARADVRRPPRRTADPWDGLSMDLIDRFLDVICLDRALTRAERRGHLEDLLALDEWMHRASGQTLVAVRGEELRTYFDKRAAERRRPRLHARLLASLHLFYWYLKESGCRSDNPAECLPLWEANAPRAWLARILTTLSKPLQITSRT